MEKLPQAWDCLQIIATIITQLNLALKSYPADAGNQANQDGKIRQI
jgi:hypothetical protein